MDNKNYKYNSVKDIYQNFQSVTPVKNIMNKIAEWLKTVEWKGGQSIVNYFFQWINLVSVVLLILVVLPVRFDYLTANMQKISFASVPFGHIIIALISFIFLSIVVWVANLSWLDIFQTGPRITVGLTILLIVVIAALFYNLLFSFFKRFIQDLKRCLIFLWFGISKQLN